jgi:hypothetical protein
MENIDLEKLYQNTGITAEAWSAAWKNGNKIQKIQSYNGCFWLKKSEEINRRFLYSGLEKASKWFDMKLLKPVPKVGGIIGITIERERILQLHKHNILVPQIITSGDDWLLLSDLGIRAANVFRSTPEVEKNYRRQKIELIANAIVELHQKGQYLSQAFDRNICFSGENQDKVGFIDFEDDPGSIFNVSDSQARDCLFFAHSFTRYFIKDQSYFIDILRLITEKLPTLQQDNIHLIAAKLAWIDKLPLQSKLGNDYKRLNFAVKALSRIEVK